MASKTDTTKTTTPDPRKVEVTALIVKLRKTGMGYPAIAKKLNTDGVDTFGSAKAWAAPVVRGICIKQFGSVEAALAVAEPGKEKASEAKAAAKAKTDAKAAEAKAKADAKAESNGSGENAGLEAMLNVTPPAKAKPDPKPASKKATPRKRTVKASA